METTTCAELIATVERDRRRFDAVLDRLRHERLADPILPGGWSVKDVLAHIAWGEREAIGLMEARALVGSPLWEVDQDVRNETVVQESRARSLEDVLEDYRTTFSRFRAALEQLSDEDLNEPERIHGLAERIPGWPPWRVIYDPDHYEDHARAIEEAVPGLRGESGRSASGAVPG